jgi:hypothetical protein
MLHPTANKSRGCTDSGHVVLSAVMPSTLLARLEHWKRKKESIGPNRKKMTRKITSS